MSRHINSWLRAVLMIAAGACLLPQATLRAQGCSRNMLSISSPGSYVVTSDVQALHLTKGFTIECWAKIASGTQPAALIDKGSPLQYCYGLFLDTGLKILGGIRNVNPIIVQSDSIDTLQNWHHYALVFVPNDSIRLYVDTVEVASQSTHSISGIDSSTDSLRIGMNANGIGMIASIDEVRIWNLARSLAAIRSTMYNTIPGSDTGLVLYYSFDDQAGSPRVHDFSGHGRDGFIRGPNAAIVQSTSPILNESPGYRLSILEQRMIIPTKRCTPSFDTVVHIRNLGSTSLNVNSVGFSTSEVFSVTPNSPFTLPPDSTQYKTLLLHFGPIAGGVYTDTLYISSTDDCAGILRIGIQATYDSVGLLCTPDSLAFGPVTQCELPQTQYVTVVNTSSTDSITILSSSIPTGSGITVLTPLPIKLAKNGSTQIALRLSNGSRGVVSASVGLDLDKCSREALIDITATRQYAGLSLPPSVNLGVRPSTLTGIVIDTFIVLTNNGDVPDAINTALSSDTSIIQILNERISHFINPGDTLHIPIQIHAKGCGMNGSKISIRSEICSVDTSSLVSVYLTPPAPLTALPLDAGIRCEPLDTTFFVYNSNNIPIRLDTISYSSDLLFFNPPLSFPETIQPHDSAIVNLRFFPSVFGDFVDTAFLHTSPCGIGTVVLSGAWGYTGLSFSPSILNFGRGCKADTLTEEVTLTNSSARTDSFANNSYTGSSSFLIQDFLSQPLVLYPGESKQISVTYTPVIGSLDTATFQLLSYEGCPAAEFHLRGSREIAKAGWTLATGEFDTICPGNISDKIFNLADHSLDSIDVLAASVAGVGFSLVKSPATFDGLGHFTIQFTPTNEQDYSGDLTLTLDSCGTSVTLPLHGSGGPLPTIAVSDTTINFVSVKVGDSAKYCVTITNPSCSPIVISSDTSHLSGTTFRLINPLDSVSIAHGDTVICIEFHPTVYGVANGNLMLTSDSAPSRTISLRGLGLAPDVRFNPRIVDFGYVLHGRSKTLAIHDTNLGNLFTSITEIHNDVADFIVQSLANLFPLTGSSDSVTFSPLNQTSLVYDTVHYLWDGHSDSVILRGFGTDSGLLASAVELDFGNVHVGTDSMLPLYLFANVGNPTIDSIGGLLIPSDTFSFTHDSVFHYTIKSDQDTFTVQITYHARIEHADTGFIVVYSGNITDTIRLIANGVESHPSVNPYQTSTLGVLLNKTVSVTPIIISNSGEYPFYIDSTWLTDPSFTVSPINPTVPITIASPLYVTITFTPARTRQITDSLRFRASHYDSVLQVILIGSGAYPTGLGPDFGYTVASRTQEEPGEYDTIPISMTGSNIDKIDADSIVLDVQFDSDMVRILGADNGSADTLVSRFDLLNAGTVECAIARDSFTVGTVMRLYIQALLGPSPSSFIKVINSNLGASQQAIDGAFDVVDCGGPVNGVAFAGPYSTNAIVPNPANDRASLTYQIGFDGPVTVEVYNAIGQKIRHIDAGLAAEGTHNLDIDVSDLPQGRYVYRLNSLDFHTEGALIIMR